MNSTLFDWKKITLMACLAIGMLFMGEVAAQDCKINLSQSDMDFGRIIPPGSNGGRESNNVHALGNRVVSLTATCPTPSNLILHVRGPALNEHFRFAEQGELSVTVSNALLDGRRVDLAHVGTAGEAPGTAGATIEAMPGDSIVAIRDGVAALGSVLSAQIEIRPQVPVRELRTRDAKVLEANLSFEVRAY